MVASQSATDRTSLPTTRRRNYQPRHREREGRPGQEQFVKQHEDTSSELEAPPPDLRDLTLWARIVDWERTSLPLPQSRPWDGARVASPQSSILRPGRESLAELDTARQQRTIHLLIKPDILTCYRQRGKTCTQKLHRTQDLLMGVQKITRPGWGRAAISDAGACRISSG